MGRDDPLLEKAEAEQELGVKALRQGELEKAVELLGRALEKKVQIFGELAPECARLYFKYGSALFYKSQEEADVLGNTKTAEAAKTVASSEAEKPPVKDSKGKGKAEVEEEENEEDEDDGDENEEEDLEGEAEEESGAEDEGDLSLAWQVLETARCIYEKMPARSLDETDVVMTLADVSLEKEDFASCIADYHRALELLQTMVPPHSRRLAEAYFRLCLAHQTANQPAEALVSCHKAIEVCNMNAEHLKSQLSPQSKPRPLGSSTCDGQGTSSAKGEASSMAPPGSSKAHEATRGEGKNESTPSTNEDTGPEGRASVEGGDTRGSSENGAKGAEQSVNCAPSAAEAGPSSAPTREELQQELEEVEAVISDLKEKESELQEVLSHPSLRHLVASMQDKQKQEQEQPEPEPASGAAAPLSESGAAAGGSGASGACAAEAKAQSKQTLDGGVLVPKAKWANATMAADEPIAVVGRGKKRIAPTPVDPSSETAAKKFC